MGPLYWTACIPGFKFREAKQNYILIKKGKYFMKKLNSLQIKLFMAFLMVLDHIPYFVSPDLALFFHIMTRCVGVWFAYMAVEGFTHTSSKFK